MTQELYWLALTTTLTACMWIPYVLHRLVRQGLGAVTFRENLPTIDSWAKRAQDAHANAIENLMVLAPLVIINHFVQGESAVLAIQIYFVTRIIHYLSYTFKIPYVRTLAFLVGWGASISIAVRIL